MSKKRTALTEEDLLTELAEKVIEVVNTYIESYEGVGLLVSQAELQGLAVDFVTNVVEYTLGQEELRYEVEGAVKKYLRDTQNRQWAVALVNAAHNYAWAFYEKDNSPNVDDLIDAKTDEVIVEYGVDLDELNEVVNSIY